MKNIHVKIDDTVIFKYTGETLPIGKFITVTGKHAGLYILDRYAYEISEDDGLIYYLILVKPDQEVIDAKSKPFY
jgi:hypothetical protein